MSDPWQRERTGDMPVTLDVDIQLPPLATTQRPAAADADAPTTQLNTTMLARATALARADTVPVPRARPSGLSSGIEPDNADTTSLAFVDSGPLTEPLAPPMAEAGKTARVIDIKKAIWAIVGVVMLAAITTAAILGVDYGSKKLGPKAIAMDYAELVVQGKIEEASKLARHTNAADDPLLSDAVYAKVFNRPTGAKLASITQDGATASATVEYTLADGTVLQEDYHLVKDGRAYVLFDRWRFEPFALATVQVTCQAAGRVTAAGVDITADAITSPTPLAAFPGSYPIEFTDTTGTFGPDKALARVAQSGQSAIVELTPEPDEAGRARITTQVQQQVDDLMDTCVKSKLLDPACGAPLNAVGAAYRGKDVTFKATSRPTAEVRYVSGTWSYAALKGHITARAGGQTFDHLFNSVGTLSVAADGAVTLQPSPLPTPGATAGMPGGAGI